MVKKTAVKLVCIELIEIKLLCVLRPRFNNLPKKYVSCRVKEFTIKRHKDVKEVIKVLTCLVHKIFKQIIFTISSDLKWYTHIVELH